MKEIIHKIVSYPLVYDLCQSLAGAIRNREILREEFSALPPEGKVVDVGGGTGLSRPLLPKSWSYYCLDPDPQKLEGFRSKFPNDDSLEASACEIPLPDNSIDLCIMVAVSHHLTGDEFQKSLLEIRRILKVGGIFILMDAVWNPGNWRGKILWSLDRGSFPKTEESLRRCISDHFSICKKRKWKIHHEYALFWSKKA